MDLGTITEEARELFYGTDHALFAKVFLFRLYVFYTFFSVFCFILSYSVVFVFPLAVFDYFVSILFSDTL